MLESAEGKGIVLPPISGRQKEDASFAYLIPFVTLVAGLPLPIVNLLVSLGYMWHVRRKPPFVRFHALQSLLTTIPVVLINAGLVFIVVSVFFRGTAFEPWHGGYLLAAIIFNLVEFVFNIYAAIHARRGELFFFWGFGEFAYESVDWQVDAHEGI